MKRKCWMRKWVSTLLLREGGMKIGMWGDYESRPTATLYSFNIFEGRKIQFGHVHRCQGCGGKPKSFDEANKRGYQQGDAIVEGGERWWRRDEFEKAIRLLLSNGILDFFRRQIKRLGFVFKVLFVRAIAKRLVG